MVAFLLYLGCLGLGDLDPEAVVNGSVRAETGEYLESIVDCVVQAPDPMVIERHYSSTWGWSFSWNSHLIYNKESSPAVLLPTGSILNTTLGIDGFSHTPRERDNLLLYKLSDNGKEKILTTPRGGQCYYQASSGRLIREKLPSGNELHYHYNDQNQLIECQETNGKDVLAWIRWTYSPNEIHLQTSDQHETRYFFQNGQLNQVTDSTSPKAHYTYDSQGRLTSHDDSLIEYKENGQVKRLVQGASFWRFDYLDRETTVIDPRQCKTVLHFTDHGQVQSVQQFSPDGNLYRVKNNLWSKTGSLIEENLSDANGKCSFKINYSIGPIYGEYLQKKTTGKLTGKEDNEESLSPLREYSDDAFHLLTRETDGQGNEWTYAYQTDTNRLIEKSFSLGGTIQKKRTFTADKKGSVKTQIFEDGAETKSTRFHLTSFGLPEKIENDTIKRTFTFTDHHSIASETISSKLGKDSYTLEKKYDEKNRLVSSSDPLGQVTQFSYDENSRIIERRSLDGLFTFSYDKAGHLIHERWGENGLFLERCWSYNDRADCVAFTDERGCATQYEYDFLGRCIRKTINGNTYSYAFDICDRIISETNPNGFTASWEYNAWGDPLRIRYPDGSQEMFSYDLSGTLHRKYLRDQTIRIYEYDDLGRVTQVEHFSQSNKGPGWFLGKRTYTYDETHLTAREDEEDREYSYSYDSLGRLLEVQGTGSYWDNREEPPHIQYTYDAWGRVSEEKRLSREQYVIKKSRYDRLGRLIEEELTDQACHILSPTRYVYGARGNLVEVEKQGRKETFEYDALHRPIRENQFRIHYQGSIQTLVDDDGSQTISSYSPEGWLLSREHRDSSGNILDQTGWTYDPCGQHLTQTITVPNREQQKTVWTYGPMGQVLSFSEGVGTAEEQTVQFIYSTDGQLVEKILPSGEKIQYTRDYGTYLDEPSYQYFVLEIRSGSFFQKFYLNSQRQVVRAVSPDAIVTREYGGLGGILEEHVTSEMAEYNIESTFDGLGRRTSVLLPDDSEILYSYNGLFPKLVSRSLNRGEEAYQHEYLAWNREGRPLEEKLIHDLGTRKTCWENGLPISIESPFFQETARYDNSLRLISSDIGKDHCEYRYDSMGQLTNEEACDALGHPVISSTNVLNQMKSYGSITCSYDAMGALKTKHREGETLNFETNVLGMPVKVTGKEGKSRFLLDAFGRRINEVSTHGRKTDSWTYFYLDNFELGVMTLDEESMDIKQLRVPSPWSHQSIAIELEENVFLPIFDLQGNIVSLISPSSGQIEESYHYTPFGSEIIYNGKGEVSEHAINPWRYCGERTDSVSKLVHFTYRDYDPELKRWIQLDPLGHPDHPNGYIFLNNNPLAFRDPFGLSCNHFYAEYKSFDDYFFHERSDENKAGPAWGFVDYVWNFAVAGYEAFTGLSGPSPASDWGQMGRYHGHLIVESTGAASIITGIVDIGAGLSGFGESAAAIVFSSGGAIYAAVPVAVGSYALITTGAAEIGAGLVIWKNASDTSDIPPPPYDGKILGEDPSKCPGEGFEWRGHGPPESGKGGWFNKRLRESLHPDLNHSPPQGPHWDYHGPKCPRGGRLYPDGRWEPK